MASHLQRMQMPQPQNRGENGSVISHPSQASGAYMPADYSGRNQRQGSIISGAFDTVNPNRGPSIIGQNGAARTGSIGSYQPSTMMGKSKSMRSMYSASNLKLSKSLGASKASLATVKSGRSTIQAEFHDMKVHRILTDNRRGKARVPYIWSWVFFALFLLTLFLGLLVICLRYIYLNIMLSMDIGEAIGPVLCALSFVFLGLGMKFLYDSYKISAKEISFIKYKPSSSSTVQATNIKHKKKEALEDLASGKTTENAVTRVPVGIQNYQYPHYAPTIID